MGKLLKPKAPPYVVIRLAHEFEALTPVRDMFRGLGHALMLLLLTVMFGSVWVQRLFFSFLFVIVFVILVFVSRTFSIWASERLQKGTGLQIIECESIAEMGDAELKLLTIRNILITNTTMGHRYLNRRRVLIRIPELRSRLRIFYLGSGVGLATLGVAFPFSWMVSGDMLTLLVTGTGLLLLFIFHSLLLVHDMSVNLGAIDERDWTPEELSGPAELEGSSDSYELDGSSDSYELDGAHLSVMSVSPPSCTWLQI